MKTDRQRDFLDPKVLARVARLELNARLPMEGSFGGQHKSPHRGSSVEFAQYREYVPGDDISKLDWRAYARSDRFYIKEFEADTNLRCHMLLDCSGSMAYGDVTGKFDYARRLAATMAHLAVRQGDAVGMCCFNGQVVEDVPARTGPRHLGAVYDVLEKVEPEGETDLVTVLHDLAERIRRRALVVVISDFFSEPGPLLDCFKHLIFRKHDLAVFHVLDPREMDFDFTRPVRFRDLESSFSMLTDPSVMRRDYMRELKAWLGELRTGCLRYKVDYHQARTSDSVEDVLSAFLLSRMRRK
ncbi:MAG: DUF58 domain-containing protein [Victivallales bacterium]|nr:DUF58 domain-containing protein [Victivallales bacterium]MBT7166198.1 DUF58 domain-containing protein [Victivallales bacterium]